MTGHVTVLLHEAVDALAPRPGGVYVDGTFGRGGHSRLLLQRMGPPEAGGRLVAFDKDTEAIAAATQGTTRIEDPRFCIRHASFAQMGSELSALGLAQVDGVLLDLGVSSPQIDTPGRGFSFRFDAPLDMRMDTTRGVTAAEFLETVDERRLTQVIRDYGEERFAGPIARAIGAKNAAGQPLRTTGELARLVASIVRTREPGQDPATRTFQALRIAVNGELDELEPALESAVSCLAPEGRLAVISFHSLEDRIVKTFIARESREVVDRRLPFPDPAARALRLQALGRVRPGEAEVRANPRSRSAILRVARRQPVAAAGAAA
jgi:16S rRNA (cytosine1402-N4)-methyltransferase